MDVNVSIEDVSLRVEKGANIILYLIYNIIYYVIMFVHFDLKPYESQTLNNIKSILFVT